MKALNMQFFTVALVVLYPLIAWGVCLTMHGLDTIVKVSGFWDNWEYRKTEELMHKERDNYQIRK